MQIVFEECVQIGDVIVQYGQMFYVYVEGEVGVDFWIDIYVMQYVWVYYFVVQYFQLFVVFIYYVNFCRWFGEWEVGWMEVDLQIFFKEVVQEVVQCFFQVGEVDIFINDQIFYLMEYWGVGLIVVVMIDVVWCDNMDRWLLVFYGVDLYVGGLCMQQVSGIELESVVVSVCWMVIWNIQCIEVVVIVFDFWVCCYGKVEFIEEIFNMVDGVSNWMQVVVFNVVIWQ